MELNFVEKLVDLMEEHDLNELEVEQNGIKVRLKKADDRSTPTVAIASPVMPAAPIPTVNAGDNAAPGAEPVITSGHPVKSPMVGTYYRAPSPGSDPFVEVGDKVTEDTILCIIEAMKVMNEIKAEVSGEVIEIILSDSAPVQYDQTLFIIKID